jgi:hypothetical protein
MLVNPNRGWASSPTGFGAVNVVATHRGETIHDLSITWPPEARVSRRAGCEGAGCDVALPTPIDEELGPVLTDSHNRFSTQ